MNNSLDLRLEIAGSIPAAGLSSATLGKLFTHVVAVTKQYNLVLYTVVEKRWCSEARKVNVGLSSHWLCVADFVVYTTYRRKGLTEKWTVPLPTVLWL